MYDLSEAPMEKLYTVGTPVVNILSGSKKIIRVVVS